MLPKAWLLKGNLIPHDCIRMLCINIQTLAKVSEYCRCHAEQVRQQHVYCTCLTVADGVNGMFAKSYVGGLEKEMSGSTAGTIGSSCPLLIVCLHLCFPPLGH